MPERSFMSLESLILPTVIYPLPSSVADERERPALGGQMRSSLIMLEGT